jgi:hypothetical protein
MLYVVVCVVRHGFHIVVDLLDFLMHGDVVQVLSLSHLLVSHLGRSVRPVGVQVKFTSILSGIHKLHTEGLGSIKVADGLLSLLYSSMRLVEDVVRFLIQTVGHVEFQS